MVVWLVGLGKEYKWMKKQGKKEDEVIIDGPTTLSVVTLRHCLNSKKKLSLSLCLIPGVGDVVSGATIQ